MKKLSKILLIIILSLSLYGGILIGLGDYELSLSGEYTLVRTYPHKISVNKQISELGWEVDIIPAKIVEIAWNDDYIIAKQLGIKNIDSDEFFQRPDKSQMGYWILEVENEKVYGPLRETEFIEKKEELYISEELVLKDIASYKKE